MVANRNEGDGSFERFDGKGGDGGGGGGGGDEGGFGRETELTDFACRRG